MLKEKPLSKALSFITSLVLAIGLMPLPAYAEGGWDSQDLTTGVASVDGDGVFCSGPSYSPIAAQEDAVDISNAYFTYSNGSGMSPMMGAAGLVFYTGDPVDAAGNAVVLDGDELPTSAYEWVFYSKLGDTYTELASAPSAIGEYAVSARGVGGYAGESRRGDFKIIARNDLEGAVVALNGETVSKWSGGEQINWIYLGYTGDPVSLDVKVNLDGVLLNEGTDYVLSFAEKYSGDEVDGTPTEMGDYRVTMTPARGSAYTGSTSAEFHVVDPTNLMYGKVTVPGGVYTVYPWNNGRPVAVDDLVVTDINGNQLSAGTDYELSFTSYSLYGAFLDSVIDEGTYQVYAQGKGDYSGMTTGDADAWICVAKPEHDISKAEVNMVSTYAYADGGSMEDVLAPVVTLAGKTLTRGTDYRLFYSKAGWGGSGSLGEHRVWLLGEGDYLGEQWLTYTVVDDGGEKPEPPAGEGSTMHRLYSEGSGEHFYTADEAEYKSLVELGWKDEGKGWTAPASSGTPVFRLYNEAGGEHHYTMDGGERDWLVSLGWVDEGVGWYSDDAKTVPLYREYNPNESSNNHNYTTVKAEHDFLVSLGWHDEGIAWYGI